MRVWDVDPGFLSDLSLLGEHRELHAIFTIVTEGKKGYSRHPETLRWKSHLGALALRHELLVEEMGLRGFRHQSPLDAEGEGVDWPVLFIDGPARQYAILKGKYEGKREGRIPLPENLQSLWANHKYSVMARDPEVCRETGTAVAAGGITAENLTFKLVSLLRERPPKGRLKNALLHMWGYVSGQCGERPEEMGEYELLMKIRELAAARQVSYLLHSTALGELGLWCRKGEG